MVLPLKDLMVGNTKATLDVLLGAVALVLLIACANVANLLLARSTVRSREMVVQGGGRREPPPVDSAAAHRERRARGLVRRSVGAWLARLGVRGADRHGARPTWPRVDEIHVDATALLFALLVSMVASFIFGLAPALQISRVQLVDGLREGGKGTSIGARGGWARSAFVVAEIALAMVLVAGAALLARSLAALSEVDMGFDSDRLLVVRTAVPIKGRDDAPRATAMYRDLLADLRALPGVETIGGVTSLPTAVRSNGRYAVEGVPAPARRPRAAGASSTS